MGGCVAIGHPICIIIMPHLTVIVRHNCRLYRVPVFIAIIVFFGWIVNVCQEVHVSLDPPHHRCQVNPGPYSNVTTLQSECLGLRSLDRPFLCSLTVPQQEIFFLGQVVKQVRGGKEVVHVQCMAKSFYHLLRRHFRLSPHVGEKVRRKNCLRTGGSSNSFPQPVK